VLLASQVALAEDGIQSMLRLLNRITTNDTKNN
jgi:hypothetical protein